MASSGTLKMLRELQADGLSLLQFDFAGGLVGAALAAWLAYSAPERLGTVAGVAGGFVGVVMGAMLAGAAILGAFMDDDFLRKIKALDKRPVRYLAPFLLTGVLSVGAMLTVLLVSALPSDDSTWWLSSITAVAGLLTTWSVLSLLPSLAMVLAFVNLKSAAAGKLE